MPFPRSSGVLLHPTSLPGPGGIGELGDHAYRWVDLLADAGQSLWQVMPLGPTGYGDSPYQSFSTFAGNPYLISLERLRSSGLVTGDDAIPDLPDTHVDFGPTITARLGRLERAARAFASSADAASRSAFEAFCEAERAWLDDFALFMALKEAHGGRSWNEWEAPLRDRDAAALAEARGAHADAVTRHKLWQHWFYEQWSALKAHANARGVRIIGDVPIFVAYDSADTWANRSLFHLDAAGAPTVVAGVPPDYFSATGQRWGNPLYRWDRMAETGFAWWIRRFESTLDFVDLVRIDHFRAFAGYWEIPAAEPTAVRGRWVKGPGQPFFDALAGVLGTLPILAEDLGVITPDVELLRDDNGLPGMKVLQFAFAGGADDPYLPHNFPANAVVYTGTHDNDTTVGWYAQAPEAERDFVRRYLARDDDAIAWELWRVASLSVADIAIAPLQDLLGLGSEARMNTPGVASGNWGWRFAWEAIPAWLPGQLRELAEVYGRVPGRGAVDTPYRQSAGADLEDD
ncbi:MAG: 4-alpha-glucanotransferase [Trueperaceae bacterium]|nr:4-alpha-glucanotransferase [Trueperaceae bacterium]